MYGDWDEDMLEGIDADGFPEEPDDYPNPHQLFAVAVGSIVAWEWRATFPIWYDVVAPEKFEEPDEGIIHDSAG